MKPVRESRTIKYQVLSAMLAMLIGGIAAFDDLLPQSYIVLLLLGLKVIDTGVNTYLRLITTQPIGKT